MQRHEWTLVVFISCVFVLEWGIYGNDMMTDIFPEPPEIPSTTCIVAFPNAGNAFAGWMATRDPQALIAQWQQAYANRDAGGLANWSFRTVESSNKNVSKGGVIDLNAYRMDLWGLITTYAYVLKDEEVSELGLSSAEIPSMEISWAQSVQNSVGATSGRLWGYAQMIWKLVSFDIPELPYYIRLPIAFPIWIALIMLAIDVVSRVIPFAG